MALVAAFLGAVIAAGIILLVVAFRPAPPKRTAPRREAQLSTLWKQTTRRTKSLILVGVVLGLIAATISGIVVLVVVVPVAVVGLPLLLGKADTRERDLLSALETWTRSLASTSETGSFTLREVIGVTRGSAPPLLRIAIDRMYNRMSGSWSNTAALRAFADELDNVAVDEVVIYLVQAAEFNAGGLAKALESLADNLATQVKQRLTIDNERDKPRRTLVTMTGIVAIVIVGIVLFSRTPQLALYRTPLGEIILTFILASFVLLLVWAKSQTKTKPESRIVINQNTAERQS
jgi:hypothetical protein